jgi:phage tail sheath gpL-like
MSGVDQTAIARVVGIEGVFQDLRTGSILNCPMQIAIVAQGSSDAVYSTAKWKATTAAAAGARYGYGSPIHRAMRRLKPQDLPGVGTVPIYVLPLSDAGGASAAVGQIEISGSPTADAQYQVVIANTKGRAFVIHEDDDDATIYRAILDSITPVLEMPVTPTYVYDTVTSAPGGSNVGNGTCTVLSVTGQPKPGAWIAKCNTAVANGGVFTLTDPDGTVIATNLTMTPGVGAATPLTAGGVHFTLTDGATNFSVNDLFTITVPVTHIALTAKWKGISGNDIVVSVADGGGGTTFSLTQPTGGLVNPTVSDRLALIGNQWITLVLNGLNIEDDDALDEYSAFGEGRRGALVHKPLVVFTGNTMTDVNDATAISEARKTDRTNSQLMEPGSDDLPIDVAARQLALIAPVANNSPASDYGGQLCTGLVPGADEDQWLNDDRETAVQGGCSTIEVVDGVTQISDVVTFYHPTGEEPPAYRYVCDIVKEMNVIYNFALKFASDDWVGKPLIPDNQSTSNKDARKPKHARQKVANTMDALGNAAIISDPAGSKKTITADISGSNPKRIDVSGTFRFAGNTNVTSIVFNWGFYYGAQAAAA